MSLALLLLALLSAGLTWNVFHPVVRPAPLAGLSFFAGWLTDELAPHHVVVQAALAAVLSVFGALHDWRGILALCILALSWIGLAARFVRSRLAATVIEQALTEELGADFDATDRAPQAPIPLDPWRLALPFRSHRRDIEVARHIHFHTAGGIDLHLDIHRPRSRPTSAPVLLYIHGGGWVMGYRDRQGLPLMQHLVSRGWVCVTASYRLSPRATFPHHLHDVKAAVHWVRTHIAEYGGDPSFIVIAGASAGGHLASLAALTPNDPTLQPGFEPADTSVAGCVSIYGVYDFADRDRLWPHRGLPFILERFVMKTTFAADAEAWDRASPLARIHAAAPPFLVLHGDSDTMVPVATARRFAAALRAVSHAPVVYAEIPGAQHAFDVFPSLRSELVVRGIARFLTFLHTHHLTRTPIPSRTSASRDLDSIAPG